MYFYMFILCVNTIASMINTNVFFDVIAFQPNPCLALPTCREQRVSGGVGQGRRQDVGHVVAVADLGPTQLPHCPHPGSGRVRKVFVHVGGTRDVPSRTDDILNIHARITLTVECIRTCICLFLFYV